MRALRTLIIAVCAMYLALPAGPVSAQGRSLEDVMSRAGAYVGAFERQLTGVVAEETYVQDTMNARDTHRELKSDLLLVRVQGNAQYVQFRDVFEVDGKPVRDRQDRLTRLFLDQSSSAQNELAVIVQESARYNIGSVLRTVNTPTLPLIFLRPDNQAVITFKLTNNAMPDLGRRGTLTSWDAWPASSDFATVPGTVVVTFQEKSKNTLIRTGGNKDLPSRGRFWIEPATGRVLMSELQADSGQLAGEIDVRYRFEPSVDMMVPSEMRERYSPFGKAIITGRATYDHFRRFQVQTSADDVKPVQ